MKNGAMPFSRIVCPHDFSPASEKALAWGVRLARDFSSRLEVVHVLDTAGSLLVQPFPSPELLATVRRAAEERLTTLRARPDLAGATVDLVEGPLHRVLPDRIAASDADLVVMGTHGLRGFERLMLGSVTEFILHHVNRPLLTVHPRVAAPDRIRVLLAATDFGAEAVEIARMSRALACRWEAPLIAAHVIDLPHAPAILEGSPWFGDAELDALAQRLRPDRRARLATLFPAGAEPPNELVLQEGRVAESICRLAGDRHADLLIVGAHGVGRSALGWIGSTCHQIIRTAPCPVLTLRRPKSNGPKGAHS